MTLTGDAEFATVYWYDQASGGNLLFTGDSFETPVLTASTNYFASAHPPSCTTAARTLVTATVNPTPELQIVEPVPSCEGVVTLSATSSTGTVQWYDAPVGGTLLFTGNEFVTPLLSQSTTFFAEAFSQFCPGNSREAVTAVVYDKPQLTDQPNVGICEGDAVVLDAGISGQTYLWSPGGQTTQTKTVTSPGVYTVTVTSPAPESCSAVKTITVLQKREPVISSVIVIGNVLTVYTENAGDFEYSVNGSVFQQSPEFFVNGGPITDIFVRSIHGCGDDSVAFAAVVIVPGYFTPNQDGFNDFWTVTGLVFYPGSSVTIFDRYGKLIQVLSEENLIWDGMYLSRPLPSD
ncbi:MAG: T9SS type B sorting domain-containing protein, partial [Sphingobacteriales bacterium]